MTGPPADNLQTSGTCNPSPTFFTGKQRDPESNLDDFGARYFSSMNGRWMSPDWSTSPTGVPYATLTNPQSLNLYAYVGNDPIDGQDPDGHMNWPLIGQAGYWFEGGEAYGADGGDSAAGGAGSQGTGDGGTGQTPASSATPQQGSQGGQQSPAQKKGDKNTDVMLISDSGSGGSANPHPSQHTATIVTMDWKIVPNVDNISQLSKDSMDAASAQYSNALILLDESKQSGPWEWQEPRKGAGQDLIDMHNALPAEQKWYINTGGVNNSSNQRIQLVIGMKPDGTLIKAWTVGVSEGKNGPIYEPKDQH